MSPPFPMPDFVTLYRENPIGITPRAAYYLWFGLTLVVDEWKMALEGDEFMLEGAVSALPPIARPGVDDRFLEQLIRSGEDLVRRLEAADLSDGLARCTANAIATHLAVQRIANDLRDLPDIVDYPGIDTDVPLQPDDPEPADYTDNFLDDLDFEILYDQSLDGFDSDPRIVQALGPRYLHPAQWFEPF